MTHFDAGLLGARQRRTGTRARIHGNRARAGQRDGDRGRAAIRGRQGALDARPRAGGRARLQRPGLQPGALADRSSSKPRTSSRRRSTCPTSTARTSRTSRPGACRSSRRAPTRACPRFGTGQYDWRGFLSQEQHPHEVAPSSDIFLNWNNKPAPGWGAASDEYSYGPVHRVQLYTGFKPGMTEADVASIMNRAATQDLRAVKDWPLIKQVLDGGPAPSKLAQEAANLVTTWVQHGASRYGVTGPEDPGAAVLDQAWRPIGEAVLGPVLGPELLSEFASIRLARQRALPQRVGLRRGLVWLRQQGPADRARTCRCRRPTAPATAATGS